MKYEFEILDKDLADRELLIGMRVLVEAEIEKLSDYARNGLLHKINDLRGALEYMENGWLFVQRDRALNKLSEVLNVSRIDLGKEYHDN
jgi:hypothetical protein